MPARKPLDIAVYNERVRTQPCFICEIVNGTSAHRIVYRDEQTIAFLNRFPTLYGYVIVSPLEHKTAVIDDFTVEEYTALHSVIHRVGRAISNAVPTERLYVLSLGSNEGNAHVHWHLAPLPPGVAYEEQQFAALQVERAGGYLDLSDHELDELAARIGGSVL